MIIVIKSFMVRLNPLREKANFSEKVVSKYSRRCLTQFKI